MAKGNLPNNKTDLATLKNDPATAVPATAAESNWFVPMAPGWGQVEKAQVLQTMLQNIGTGKKSVEDAAKDADAGDRQGHQRQVAPEAGPCHGEGPARRRPWTTATTATTVRPEGPLRSARMSAADTTTPAKLPPRRGTHRRPPRGAGRDHRKADLDGRRRRSRGPARPLPADPRAGPRLSAGPPCHPVLPEVRAVPAVGLPAGRVGRASTTSPRCSATASSGHVVVRTIVFAAGCVVLTMVVGMLIALLLQRVSGWVKTLINIVARGQLGHADHRRHHRLQVAVRLRLRRSSTRCSAGCPAST